MPRQPTNRRYTRKQKLSAVTLALVGNPTTAAEATGIPQTNIRRWKDDPEMAEYGLKTREEIAEEARALGVKVLAEIKDRLGEFEPRDLSILWGILTDKSQLLSGEATSRSEHRDLTDALNDHERDTLAGILRDAVAEKT